MFPGEERVYLSADSIEDASTTAAFPTEFLNMLTPSGMPCHKMRLKLNCPVILMRNINASEGLCNGTRMLIRRMQNHLLDCEITNGSVLLHAFMLEII
jgi:ATP-dependent DNA helicase PIF1